MSTEISPKGSADWLEEQDGGDMTPPVKGTQEWAEQNSGGKTPEPAESKPVPQTDVAPQADKQAGVSTQNNESTDDDAGVSTQNNGDAVKGYDRQIELLTEIANRTRPETEAEREKRERKERSKRIIAAVGDGLMALSNLYFTSKGAPNMYNHKTMSQQAQLQAQLDRLKAEREANTDRYLQYSLKIGDLQNDRAKTLREMEAEQEKRKLAREKAEREAEAHGWLRELQPDKKREQAGKATKAEQDAVTAGEEAKNASDLYKAKVETEKKRGEAATASAASSYASAAAHDRSNQSEFSAWDENGKEHKFRTKEAADNFARQHGTLDYAEETGKDSTATDVTDKRGRVVMDETGNPVRKTSEKTTTKQVGYPKKVDPENERQKKANPMGGNVKKKNPMS